MTRTWAKPPTDGLTTVLVTGGAGFIGSCFLNCLVPKFPEITWVNVDKLTYAGNPLNLSEVSGEPNYRFERVDIVDPNALAEVFERHQPDWVFHFAAETHVDRSIKDPQTTIEANVVGTFNLLEAARQARVKLFHHIGTDEVFGSLGKEGKFSETTPYDPSSPYSASKAGADHLVRAWHRTFGMNIRLTHCSNNYGPRQFPEKLIPLMILNAANSKALPVYGDGSNVRDWLFVEDHCEAIWLAACKGSGGETYTIGGESEISNLHVAELVCDAVASVTSKDAAALKSRIELVADRPGHDWRYAMDTSKSRAQLGWSPKVSFTEGLRETVEWYLGNPGWVQSVQTGEYLSWMQRQYGAKA